VLLGIRAVQGFGFSFNGTALMTMATDIIPEQKLSEGIGYLGLTQTVAQAFGPAFALALKSAFGYTIALKLVFLVTILNLLTRFSLKTVGKERGQKSVKINSLDNSQSSRKLKRMIDKDAWKPSLLIVFIMFAASGIGTFLLVFATQRNIENPGMFFTITAIFVAVARLSVGRIHNKYGSVAVLIPGFFLTFLSLILIYYSSNLPVLLAAGASYGLGLGAIMPEINTLAILAAEKENRGMANSTVFMAMDLGMAIGAVSLGLFADYIGLANMFLLCAGVVFVTLLAYLFLLRTGFYGESTV
jgi:MFS family permease